MSADSTPELIVACKSWQEAQYVIDHLFERTLITAAECIESASSSKLFEAPSGGVMVLLTTAEHLFDQASAEVRVLQGGDALAPTR